MARFKARARSVDLLGRQQIAGIPTALSEIFKNAHDAYADFAEADFFRESKTLVIIDDGLGMTHEEFIERWLTLGTESKSAPDSVLGPPPIDPDKDPRPLLGEKGIGRLAIAVLGPQVLILTRAKRGSELSPLVVAFVNWSFYALPGVDLEDIEIPEITIDNGRLPTRSQIKSLLKRSEKNLDQIAPKTDPVLIEAIRIELHEFSADPVDLDRRTGAISLTGDGHGTQFIVQPTSEVLELDIDTPGSDDSASPLIKSLIGFSDTMSLGHSEPKLLTEFHDHRSNDTTVRLIGENRFFTERDFNTADHRISGSFNEYGQFSGTVSVYGTPPESHVVPWSRARGRPTRCGPFTIDFAYVQGAQRSSKLARDEFEAISAKLRLLSGLYIYRNGIRVLPYGNSDFDFLDIEVRRSKSARYYFFSYRRMLGLINIDSQNNSNLVEKAGREGFSENLAYRQFKEILTNFFVQTAADFFRVAEEGPQPIWSEIREQLQKEELAKKKRSQLAGQRKRSFQADLDHYFEYHQSGAIENELSQLLISATEKVDKLESIVGAQNALNALLEAENEAQEEFDRILQNITLTRPRGLALSIPATRDWNAYQETQNGIRSGVVANTQEKLERLFAGAAAISGLGIDRRKEFDMSVNVGVRNLNRKLRSTATEAQKANRRSLDKINEAIRDITQAVSVRIKQTQTFAASTEVEKLSSEEFIQLRLELDRTLDQEGTSALLNLEAIKTQMDSLVLEKTETGEYVTSLDLLESAEQEVETASEQFLIDLELTQLGSAVSAVGHEFLTAIKGIRENLRKLARWGKANPRLNEIYRGMRTNFDHLDSYLNMFTPLQLRAEPLPTKITGAEVSNFAGNFFETRLTANKITLTSTDEFKKFSIFADPAHFLPVVVNLIDNAIYWLSDHSDHREIRLHSQRDDEFRVSDSGPGIPIRNQDSVFLSGFTRKPGGRGLGLFIARESLKRIGYQITLEKDDSMPGASFRVSPSPEQGSAQ